MPFDPISYSLAKKGLTWEKVKQLMKTEGALNLKYDSDLDGYIDRIGPHTHDIADIIFNGDFDPTTDNTYEIGKLYKRLKDIHSVHLSLDGDEITNPELYFYNDYLRNGWKIRYEFNEEAMYTEYFLRFNIKRGAGDIPMMYLYYKAAEVEEQSLRLECHILPVHDDSLYIGDSSHRFKEIHAVTGHLNNLYVEDNLAVDGKIMTSSYIIEGYGNGGVALTHNDGYGNANVVFNHVAGVPEQDGNAARIVVNTDSTTGANIEFQVKSGVTAGAAVALTKVLRLYESYAQFLVDIQPDSDNTRNIGTSSKRFKDGYIVNVYTGDIILDNGWKITERDDSGNVMENAIRILNKKGEEIFRVSEDGLYFKGKKIV